MTTPINTGLERTEDLDWEKARVFLRQRVQKHLRGHDPALLEDQTQIALAGLLKAVRKEGARNLEALMTEIARRVSIDFVRRKKRWDLIVRPMDDLTLEMPDRDARAPDHLGDPLERLQFEVLEFFRSRKASCLELAHHFFAGLDWPAVAEHHQVEPSTIRQRWSRCIALLRESAGKSDDILSEWARDFR